MEPKFIHRVCANILPLSTSRNINEAFIEWTFTEVVHDHGEPTAHCELCDQKNVRYHFQIGHASNGNTLMVGSDCISKFGVGVYQEGIRLDAVGTHKRLAELTQQMRHNTCLKMVEQVVKQEPTYSQGMLQRALDHYKKYGSFTPKYAAIVLYRLNKYQMDYNPNFFKVSLQKQQHRDDLKQLEPWQIRAVWPALSGAQQTAARLQGVHPS